ncbi:MAG TPA: hypothetical protein VGN16_05240, partial [Acidobacteriaceae bacterium]
MSESYTVQVFRVARADVPRPEVYWMEGWTEWETLYFYMVLIAGGNVKAVINTGPPQDLETLNVHWRKFAGPRCQLVRDKSEMPTDILKRVGLNPTDITHVLLTPLQLYATANLGLFSNAQICMSRRGWIEDVLAPQPWVHTPRHLSIADETLRHLLFEDSHRLMLLEDEDQVCPGIQASWVGAHHRSSMLYLVATTKGSVGISDCAFKYPNLFGHPLG